MNNPNVPVQSTTTLIISSISAVIIAAFILITVVGPAEYGIDPTGLGKAMGLNALAKSTQQHQIPTSKTAISCPAGSNAADWLDVVIITVPAASGLEYKFNLNKDAHLAYEWTTDGSKLHFDFHGEPAGDTSGYFKSYQETTDHQSKGVLAAPFSGVHGWYWENNTQQPVQITLQTRGTYSVKGLI